MGEAPVELAFRFSAGAPVAPMSKPAWRVAFLLSVIGSSALLFGEWAMLGGLALFITLLVGFASLVKSVRQKGDLAIWVLTTNALERRHQGSVWSLPYGGIQRIRLDRAQPCDEGFRVRIRASSDRLLIVGEKGTQVIPASLIWFREFHRTLIALCEARASEREDIIRRARAHWTEGGTLPFREAPYQWQSKNGV